MADKKESDINPASDFSYVRALDANGNSIKIHKDDLTTVISAAIGLANTNRNGLQRSTYAHSGDILLSPGQIIDTKLNYGLLIINHPSAGDSAVFLCDHFDINIILSKYSASLEDAPGKLYVYKESPGASAKIKNNYSEERLMSFHCL